jgi:hypothetical protein
MSPALVKVDVVSALLGWPVKKLYSLVDESSLNNRGFAWVFNLSRDPQNGRQDLRWWWPEIQARLSPDGKENGRFAFYELGWVIDRIVPGNRPQYPAGEVDRLFQISQRNRIRLHMEFFDPAATIVGAGTDGPAQGMNQYPRAALAGFLERRWIQNLKKSVNEPKILTTTETYAHAQ